MIEGQLPLDGLQAWMQSALIFPKQTSREEAERIVESSPRLTGTQRLAIYQRSYYLRILKCMAEQFPALCHALGEDLFTDFARQYLQACPSESYTLYDLGRRFPAYLEETRPDRREPEDKREKWAGFMVDLARFERQIFLMFDAPGHEGKPFANENTPDCRLGLQPCFALGAYQFPVAWYYHEVRKGKAPPFPPQEKSWVALVRKDYLTHTVPLAAAQYSFLAALERGKNVEVALELVARETGRSIEEVSASWTEPNGIRKRWIEAGFFITGIP